MLQVRAGHCPNCKEATPPGADYCPICGEDLTWKTTDGKDIPKGTASFSKSSSMVTFFWISIAFVSACLISMMFAMLHLRSNPNAGKARPPANNVIVQPGATPLPQGTPQPETAETRAENEVSDNVVTGNTTTDNAVSDNSVSNSATPPDPGDLSNLGIE